MEPDESGQALDELLEARLRGAYDPGLEPPDEYEDEYEAELAVAERIAAGQGITPSSDFAQSLKARFLAAAEVARGEQRQGAPSRPAPTRPQWQARHAGVNHIGANLRSRSMQVATLAVILLIALGAGLLLVAASAPPASPLYSIRRAQQSISVRVAANKPDEVELHVSYAGQALAELADAVSKYDLERYRAALSTMIEEDKAALAVVTAVPAGDQRTRLVAQVTTLRAREVNGLRAALPALGWHDRILTTSVLAGLDVSAPSVTNADIIEADTVKGSKNVWQVTVTGHGFQFGAILLVNGSQRAAVVSVTDNVLIAEVSDGSIPGSASVGVGNPDNTAANALRVTRRDTDGAGQSTLTATTSYGNGNGDNRTTELRVRHMAKAEASHKVAQDVV
jgi:hypothetical protein